ncbi:MAG: acyl-CoA thioesterase [Proteobacteria bacterium]|nr:acyl-CoA thioesterase [Pseudomonadota bacterium]
MTAATGAQSRTYLMERGIFKAWCRISVRYNDLDPLGHVNNTGMAIFLEEARCQLITPRIKVHGRHLDMVLATTEMDYRREMHYPGEVEVGTLVKRIGSKSFGLVHGVFQDGVCTGTAELAMVLFDLEKRVAVAPAVELRDFLVGLM